jgi:hypothetical protein
MAALDLVFATTKLVLMLVLMLVPVPVLAKALAEGTLPNDDGHKARTGRNTSQKNLLLCHHIHSLIPHPLIEIREPSR